VHQLTSAPAQNLHTMYPKLMKRPFLLALELPVNNGSCHEFYVRENEREKHTPQAA